MKLKGIEAQEGQVSFAVIAALCVQMLDHFHNPIHIVTVQYIIEADGKIGCTLAY